MVEMIINYIIIIDYWNHDASRIFDFFSVSDL